MRVGRVGRLCWLWIPPMLAVVGCGEPPIETVVRRDKETKPSGWVRVEEAKPRPKPAPRVKPDVPPRPSVEPRPKPEPEPRPMIEPSPRPEPMPMVEPRPMPELPAQPRVVPMPEAKPPAKVPGEQVPRPRPQPQPRPANDDWVPFRSQAGRFTASFPTKPEEKTHIIKTPDGPVKRNTFLYQDDSISLAVHVIDLTQPAVRRVDPVEIISGEKNGIIEGTRGKLIDEKLREIPNRLELELESVIAVPNRSDITVRWVPRRGRLFTLIVSGKQNSPPRDEVRKFLDSFKTDD